MFLKKVNPLLILADVPSATTPAVAGLAAVAEDIAGNTDGIPATAAQINAIAGVSGEDYSVALTAGTYTDPANPTPAEI